MAIMETPIIAIIGNVLMTNSKVASPELKSILLNDIQEPLIFLVVSFSQINPSVKTVKKMSAINQTMADMMPKTVKKKGRANVVTIKKVAIQDKTKKKTDHFFKACPFFISSLDKSSGASIDVLSLLSM